MGAALKALAHPDRKSDKADAVRTALATRGTGEPRDAVVEGPAAPPRLLLDRRDDMVPRRTEAINRLHALLLGC